MSRKQTRLVEEFQAVGDDGKSYEISVYQEFIDTSIMRNPNKRIPGMQEMTLGDGGHVNWIDENTFQIVSSGQIVRRAN